MSKQRILYIDGTFIPHHGGDMNRSRFLWKTLSESFEADMLLIKREADTDEIIAEHKGDHQLDTLPVDKGGIGLLPKAIERFDEEALAKYRKLLKERDYDYVFLRAVVPALLAFETELISPQTKVIVDSDLVFSVFNQCYWQKKRSISNRFFLIESLKFRWFERDLYRRPYLFLFANPEDQKLVEKRYWRGTAPSKLTLHPNAICFKEMEPVEAGEKNILFFGALAGAPNIDAFQFLMNEVYPLIKDTLTKTGVKIHVAGRNQQPIYAELVEKHDAGSNVRIVGEVDDMPETVRKSLFTIFPVRQSSGTRVRVLEAAKAKRTGVTTTLGAEGYDIDEDSLLIRDTAEDYAQGVIDLLEDPSRCEAMGQRLYESAKQDYGEELVAKKLVEDIRAFQPGLINLAIVANRFYPEVGGAETNIFFQANELAASGCRVTVYSPKRIVSANRELISGFRVRRLWNLFNPFCKFPSNLAKTFCPSLPFHLFSNRYDVVQSFPAPHYNALTALLCQKALNKKSVLVSFDFRDYATIIQSTGKVTDMLRDYEPNCREKFALKHFDHVFAISNKEIDFIHQFTDKVSYSPVPILTDEYERQVDSPRSKYGLSQDDFVFLSLGRVSNVKGQDIALKAFDEALPQLPGAKLVVVGRRDMEPGFNKELSDYVAENGLEMDVIFTDVVEREEVLGWLRHCDIHVIPVRFMNSGAVVVESWASGTPVIQSDVVDPNLVEDGKNGFIFKSLSIEDLAETMVRARDQREAFDAMAERGRALVLERYSYDYLTKLYLDKYRELMAS